MHTPDQRQEGFPLVLWSGETGDHLALVQPLLGPSLEQLFDFCGRRFSLKTVLLLADQLLARLEYMHACGILHRVSGVRGVQGVGASSTRFRLIKTPGLRISLSTGSPHAPFLLSRRTSSLRTCWWGWTGSRPSCT